MTEPLHLDPGQLFGGMTVETGEPLLERARWYRTEAAESGLQYFFPEGALAEKGWLSADMLADGTSLIVFVLTLQEGEEGPRFGLCFCALNQCQLRIRLPLEAVDQNRWQLGREGAYLKPMCWGDRVELAKVDRMTLAVLRKGDEPARFCVTDFAASVEEPPVLKDPLLPAGKLVDALGQSATREWATKSHSAKEVTARLQRQVVAAPEQRMPEGLSRWGGYAKLRLGATGFFRTHHDGKRWWLVDPDGYAFWSTGLDCVWAGIDLAYKGLESALTWTPSMIGPYREIYGHGKRERTSINYLAANFIRAFGADWHTQWAAIALAELRRLGFNTVANWSEWEVAQQAQVPYVRPLEFDPGETPQVFRDFPDVFAPSFAEAAREYARQLEATKDDPALIGYFLMNEPTWGFAKECPAEGMLLNTPVCATRPALARFLAERHGGEAGLAQAWGSGVTLAQVAEGKWHAPLTEAAHQDLEAFSTVMLERLFTTLTEACRAVDPSHLNLGARYYICPPPWALAGMGCFDVFSMNCYRERIDPRFEEVSRATGRPIMVGEWHFGALDVGLPASGIGRVKDQEARGQAYRVYLEDAAAQPWCVGAHYFTLYDQSALGRFDGECYNIGFLDVCNRPYEPLGKAARASHERMYEVALGEVAPYDEAPEYLPRLFA